MGREHMGEPGAKKAEKRGEPQGGDVKGKRLSQKDHSGASIGQNKRGGGKWGGGVFCD